MNFKHLITISGFNDWVAIDWWERWHNKKRLCRNQNCPNTPHSPYHYYCSEKCHDEFLKYYLGLAHWESVKSKALDRDKYTCQICGFENNPYSVSSSKYYDFKNPMEVDHITPRAVIKRQMANEFNKLPRKQRRRLNVYRDWNIKYLEIANDPKNLRTLCKKCHKTVTADFLGSDLGKQIREENRRATTYVNRNWSCWDYADEYFPIPRNKRIKDYTKKEQKIDADRELFLFNDGWFANLVFWDNIHNTIRPMVEIVLKDKMKNKDNRSLSEFW